MCRLAAYLAHDKSAQNSALSLQQFFTAPEHSLYRQAWEPKELRYAKLNADGFGVAWWPHGAAEPARYVQDCATWNDLNLPHLGRAIQSSTWLGSVRSATAGQPMHAVNTQPFVSANLAFAHNGYIGGFRRTVKAVILDALSGDIAEQLIGSTDSEHLFALVQQHAVTLDAESALKAALNDVANALPDNESALLNVIVATQDSLIVSKHALRAPCPSLYATNTHPDFPGWLVASEAFDDHPSWQPIDDHTVIVLSPGKAPHHSPIASSL